MPATQTTIIPTIGNHQFQLLERLTDACAVSGDEGAIRQIIMAELADIVDEAETDPLGNLLLIRRSQQQHPLRVMLAAHMDEVGLMLTARDGDGFFRFETIGGVNKSYLPGKLFRVGANRIPGVIGLNPFHLSEPSERQNSISIDSLRLDVGSENAGRVNPGDRAAFASCFTRMGPSLRAKALDNRVGVATLVELVRHAPPNIDLLAAFTVQEEIGGRGAQVAAYRLNPDIAMAIDCTPAYDFPSENGAKNTRYNSQLDAGPAIYIADRATLSDPRLVRHLIASAEQAGIPYQLRQPGGGGTDAGTIHLQRSGIPSISISVPGRYAHTPAGLIRIKDWENTLALLHTALSHLPSDLLATPR